MRGNTKILQVEMKNGNIHFTKEESVKQINPAKLVEFY
jgi:hypothetical protein